MNSVIKWIAKKYVISAANGLLSQYKDDVSKVTGTLKTWIERLGKVLNLLECLNDRVEDGKIDAEEVEASLDQITNLVKEW